MEQNRICEIISEIQPLFKNYVGSPLNAKERAQDALNGLNHYADDNTLKFFNARINGAKSISGGLFFVVFESLPKNFNGERIHRYKMFNVFGEQVVRHHQQEFSSVKQAEKMFWAWYNEFNAIEHYKQAVADEAIRAKDKYNNLNNCFSELIGIK